MHYKEVEEKYKEWANILKALSHPIRLYIIELLKDGEKCVCEIDEKLHIDMSTVSRHLSTLRKSGIIKDEKRGNQVYYTLKVPCVLNFLHCAENVTKESIEEKIKILNM
jgi:ArsR family transcriptional regulator